MSLAYLKVKIKSLAEEACIIRHEERKYLRSSRWLRRNNGPELGTALSTWGGLNTHRLQLRVEQRAAFLAYGYLRGRAYRQIEQAPCYLKAPFCRPGPSWSRVQDLVLKYGPDKDKKALWDKLVAWRGVVIAEKPLPREADALHT